MRELVAGFLCCLVPVSLVVLAALYALRRKDSRLAAQWQQLQIHQAHSQDAAIAVVQSVYQRARRGTKAVIRWQETGYQQDTWFKGWHPEAGSWLLLRGSTGWGPHNRNPHVFYVNPGDLVYAAPRGARAAADRQARRGVG